MDWYASPGVAPPNSLPQAPLTEGGGKDSRSVKELQASALQIMNPFTSQSTSGLQIQGVDDRADGRQVQYGHLPTPVQTGAPHVSQLPGTITPNQCETSAQYSPSESLKAVEKAGFSNSEPIACGFRKVHSKIDLSPDLSHQPPPFRRAHPDGGFISPVQALTLHLSSTYRICNPNFKYESSRNPRRVLTKPSKGSKNEGYDNEDSDYILYVNDILGSDESHRYLILDVLGQGTFGQVVKCQNLKTKEVVAVKVVKNKPAYFNQSMMEVTILELLNSKLDRLDEHHLPRLYDTFVHCQHLCIVCELLSVNLYELIKQNGFRGLSTNLVRVFSTQLLDAMVVLNEAKLIHCDLKPENILLKNPTIKVIDFGSACHERQTVYTYIQSRFYRSPEVLLGLPYTSAIDMWSLGCIVVELFLGLPLFPGSSEYNQVSRIIEMLGLPPSWMLDMGKQSGEFFEKCSDEMGRKSYRLKSMERYAREHNTNETPSKKYFTATTLPEIIRSYPVQRKNMKEVDMEKEMQSRISFVDFVAGLLNPNPLERWSPQQAKLHPFITGDKYTGRFIPPMHIGSSRSPVHELTPHPPPHLQQNNSQFMNVPNNGHQLTTPQRRSYIDQSYGYVAGYGQNYHQHSMPAAHMSPSGRAPNMQQSYYAPPAYAQPSLPPPAIQHIPHQQQQHHNSHLPQTQPMLQGPGISYSMYPPQHSSRPTSNRPRATTYGNSDFLPPQMQHAASFLNPGQPIRSQPSPYYPPPDTSELVGPTTGQRGRRHEVYDASQGDFIRTLEDLGSKWA